MCRHSDPRCRLSGPWCRHCDPRCRLSGPRCRHSDPWCGHREPEEARKKGRGYRGGVGIAVLGVGVAVHGVDRVIFGVDILIFGVDIAILRRQRKGTSKTTERGATGEGGGGG